MSNPNSLPTYASPLLNYTIPKLGSPAGSTFTLGSKAVNGTGNTVPITTTSFNNPSPLSVNVNSFSKLKSSIEGKSNISISINRDRPTHEWTNYPGTLGRRDRKEKNDNLAQSASETGFQSSSSAKSKKSSLGSKHVRKIPK